MIDMQKISTRILVTLVIILVFNRLGILFPLTFLGAYLGHKKKVKNAKFMFTSDLLV